MKKNLFIPLFVAACLLAMMGCRDKDDLPTYYIPQDMKDYVMFPVGSYWIYEDSLTGAIDSVYLAAQRTKIENLADEDTRKAENLEQYFKSSFLNMTYLQGTKYVISLPPDAHFFYLGRRGYFFAPAEVDETVRYIGYIKCVAFYDSVQFHRVKYDSIRVFSCDEENYYWAKNIGLIRQDVYTNGAISNTWYLKRYKINR